MLVDELSTKSHSIDLNAKHIFAHQNWNEFNFYACFDSLFCLLQMFAFLKRIIGTVQFTNRTEYQLSNMAIGIRIGVGPLIFGQIQFDWWQFELVQTMVINSHLMQCTFLIVCFHKLKNFFEFQYAQCTYAFQAQRISMYRTKQTASKKRNRKPFHLIDDHNYWAHNWLCLSARRDFTVLLYAFDKIEFSNSIYNLHIYFITDFCHLVY